MIKTVVTFLFLYLPFASKAQIGISKYFEYNLYPRADFADYLDVDIKWDFNGPTQREFNTGLTALKQGNYRKAISGFNEAIKLSPDEWVAFYYRALCHKAVGNLPGALMDLKHARKQSPNTFQIAYELGETFQGQGKYYEALWAYDIVTDLAPKEVFGYYGTANIAFLANQYDKAARFYKKCIEADPTFPDAYVRAGLLRLFVNRREKEAIQYLDKAIEVDPTFADGLFWRGLINIEFGQTDKALIDWNKLIQLNPNKPLYKLVRGYLFIELNDFDKAFTDIKNAMIGFDLDENLYTLDESQIFNKQIDLQASTHYLMRNIYGLPDEAAAPLRKAYCLLIKSDYDGALTALNFSVKQLPSASAFLLKASTFEYLGKQDSAFSSLNKTLTIDNSIFEAHKKRAIYLTSIQDWNGATQDFMEMERLQPGSIITYKLRAQLKQATNDFYGVVADASRYLKTDSTNKEMLELRASALSRVNDLKGCKKDYEALVRLDSTNSRYVQLAYSVAMHLRDTLSALQVLEKSERHFLDEAFPFLQQMEIHIWNKDWTRAMACYNNYDRILFKTGQNRSQASFLRGLVFLGQGEREMALESFNYAIESGNAVGFVNLEAHFERGKINLEKGKRRQTKSDFKILKAHNYEKHQALINEVLDSTD